MAIFNSYVKLPEVNRLWFLFPRFTRISHGASCEKSCVRSRKTRRSDPAATLSNGAAVVDGYFPMIHGIVMAQWHNGESWDVYWFIELNHLVPSNMVCRTIHHLVRWFSQWTKPPFCSGISNCHGWYQNWNILWLLQYQSPVCSHVWAYLEKQI